MDLNSKSTTLLYAVHSSTADTEGGKNGTHMILVCTCLQAHSTG